jgi:hypothetical protein
MENLANPQTPILKLFILTISTMTTSAAIWEFSSKPNEKTSDREPENSVIAQHFIGIIKKGSSSFEDDWIPKSNYVKNS